MQQRRVKKEHIGVPSVQSDYAKSIYRTDEDDMPINLAEILYGPTNDYGEWYPTKEKTGRRGDTVILAEKLELVDWNTYCQLVSNAYDEAPANDPKAHGSYSALRAAVVKFFDMISSKVEVQFVEGSPYQTSQEMQAEVAKTKVLKIMKEFSDHPFFTEEENWKFRAVHDWFSHILAKQPFDQKGEIRAYNTHTKMFPKASLPALFTEVIGQVCYNTTHGGEFPVQKVAILPGFDYENLGRVEGWRIEKKKLVKEELKQVLNAGLV